MGHACCKPHQPTHVWAPRETGPSHTSTTVSTMDSSKCSLARGVILRLRIQHPIVCTSPVSQKCMYPATGTCVTLQLNGCAGSPVTVTVALITMGDRTLALWYVLRRLRPSLVEISRQIPISWLRLAHCLWVGTESSTQATVLEVADTSQSPGIAWSTDAVLSSTVTMLHRCC